MSTKVEVFTSPGWEAEVDTDWAEGLFAVFLRSAGGRGKQARGGPKHLGNNEPSDGVILLTVRKDGVLEAHVSDAPPPAADGTPTTPTAETRRTKRPRRADEGTAKLRDSAPAAAPVAPARSGTSKRSAPRSRPIPPPPPARSRPIPPPPPARGRSPAPPSRPPRTTPSAAPSIARQETVRDSLPRDLRTTVPAAAQSTPLDDEGIKNFLFEMAALVKYGHGAQVRAEFDRRLPEHAEDPRFRRLMISFYFEHDLPADGIDALFGLASLYFDRRDLPRMRECLDEILRHEPSSRRARKMRELLDKRPGRTRPPPPADR